ncbi:MAG: DUF2905 domain-containing protein [Anaerolineae bacterium]|nr:DUF2905 domain-containing protein [Anaerolineae bacterium]
MEELGKMMLLFGAIFLLIGAMIVLFSKLTGLGRLPGDILIQTGNISCFFPIVSSILLSIILTILLNIILRVLNR